MTTHCAVSAPLQRLTFLPAVSHRFTTVECLWLFAVRSCATTRSWPWTCTARKWEKKQPRMYVMGMFDWQTQSLLDHTVDKSSTQQVPFKPGELVEMYEEAPTSGCLLHAVSPCSI